ncbi:secretory component protein Shr3p [[Candida] railenensis]|uniref:Secretory component protein Shr3p n=1 Tax=[Candida] railenensis TaxID=45579 RepID=A0A9P0VYU7_9ASCO|nr:secretory component protein Shr3p [[Candida] railenensis]
MAYIAYKDIVPIGTGLIIAATSFGLGVIYGNAPYDQATLFQYDPSGQNFERSLAHYILWANTPMYVHYVLHGVFVLGLIGCFIKLYKPNDEATYFEYGTLGLYVLSFIIYLTNLRTGVNSCLYDSWGEVDMPTGINVMAASQIMIVLVLVGVLTMQGGLYYATWYDEKIKKEFLEQEAAFEQKRAEAAASAPAPTKTKAAKAEPVEPVAATKATGAAKSKTSTVKKTKKTK